MFKVQENNTAEDLETIVSNIFKKVIGRKFNKNDYSDIFRLGKKGYLAGQS